MWEEAIRRWLTISSIKTSVIVTVLDISAAALGRAKARLGDRADLVTWIEADITDFRSSRTYDVWHDRAAFHFLTEAEDREKYCETMNRAVSAQGHVIIATFAYEAPPTCSGLPVVRYSPEFLTLAIGSNFELVESVRRDPPDSRGQQATVYLLPLYETDRNLGERRTFGVYDGPGVNKRMSIHSSSVGLCHPPIFRHDRLSLIGSPCPRRIFKDRSGHLQNWIHNAPSLFDTVFPGKQ